MFAFEYVQNIYSHFFSCSLNLFLALGFSPEPERISERWLEGLKNTGGICRKNNMKWKWSWLCRLSGISVKTCAIYNLFRGFCWLGAIYHFEAFDIYKMLQILFYTFPGSDLTLLCPFNVSTTDMYRLLMCDYNHMIPHLVSFTPRRNLTSFSFSSPLSRVAIVFSISAVLVPIICYL